MIRFFNKNTLITVLLVVVFPISLFSKNDGEKLFNSKQYAKAKIVYANLLKRNKRSVLYNYRFARCCYELNENKLAIKHFEKAGNRYALRNYYLGELYFYAYRFDESIVAYTNYMAKLDTADSRIASLEKKIKKSELGAKLFKRVQDIAIIDSITVNKKEFLKFYKFSKELGNLQYDSIQLKDQTILDKVKYTTERGDRICFSDTTNISNIDIYTSYKLLDKWSKPVSISKLINTSLNENYPFLLLDGVTLFYASDSENSLGGYDIFMTRFSATSKSYLNPENIGMPFNSPYNDYMMVMDELNKVGWFATDRNQEEGKVVIYQFELNDPKKYFRSEDIESQSNVARLLQYRKARNIKKNNQLLPKDIDNEKKTINSNFELVINDSTFYNRLEQIQSTLALRNMKEWLSLKKNQTNREHELDDLRTEYTECSNQSKKSLLKKKILSIEKTFFETELILKNKLIEATNEEIKFIQKN